MTLERPSDPNETAMGRKLKFERVGESYFMRLTYADGKGGKMPDKYSGLYTSEKEADIALKAFVEETWRVAEDNSPKPLSKKSA